MANIPSKVENRITSCLKRFQPILTSAKARDVNESDTAIIVTDMLSEIFGYDKYVEITSEHAIRSTFCDLAISLDGKAQFLVEIKAIGLELKDAYVKQAVDYAANKGVDWVILTNGVTWRVYKIFFGKPIDQDLVAEINFLTLNPKNDEDLSLVFLLTKEGWVKQVLTDFCEQKQALSRFTIGATVMSEPVLDVIRRELRRVCPEVKIKNEQIQNVLLHEVIKREVVEGDKAEDARKKLARAANKALKAKAAKDEENAPAANIVSIPTPPASPSSTSQPITA